MTSVMDILVPDGVTDAAVIEIMLEAGAVVETDESLLAIETDKATAEVPAPAAGKLIEISVQTGDSVSSGSVIGKLQVGDDVAEPEDGANAKIEDEANIPANIIDIVVPDGVADAAVIEIMREAGAEVETDESLLAIETDKATAEVPAPAAGKLLEISVQTGDSVSSGSVIGRLQVGGNAAPAETKTAKMPPTAATVKEAATAGALETTPKEPPAPPVNRQSPGAQFHASPSVRQFARELGVELGRIQQPSGPKGRITFADVKALVKIVMSGNGNAVLPELELPDFRKFGETEERPLSKIKQLTGEHLHKGWLNIPLVTHFEEADISELEAFRKELNQRPAVAKGELGKTTALSFIVKAVVRALQHYPQLNSSLSGKSIILKKYYHIGIAVDTPRGLLVPVIPNADTLSLDQISAQIKMLGTKGRAGKLESQDMEGGSFTISSLGSLGGTNFTPLVNAPEAAILGVAKAAMKPVWNGSEFVPRLILPFSVSYDHRILDGGEVARFATALAGYLSDLRYILV